MTSEMERLIRSRHRKEARYAVQNLSSVLETVHTVSLAMSLVLIGVAVLTLIVAGRNHEYHVCERGPADA